MKLELGAPPNPPPARSPGPTPAPPPPPPPSWRIPGSEKLDCDAIRRNSDMTSISADPCAPAPDRCEDGRDLSPALRLPDGARNAAGITPRCVKCLLRSA